MRRVDQICISIDMAATGRKIRGLLYQRGYTVHDVQTAMGFNNPQAVYKWLTGKALPSVDNLLILSRLLNESINNILVTDEDISMSGDIYARMIFSLKFLLSGVSKWRLTQLHFV